MKLGEVIDKYVVERGTTWNKLRESTGIHITTIYNIKNNKVRTTTFSNVLKISKVLDIDMNEFKNVDWSD